MILRCNERKGLPRVPEISFRAWYISKDAEICKTIKETTRSLNRARKSSRYVNEIFVRLISASIGRKGARVQPPSPQENDTETSSLVSERRGNRDSIEWQMRREIERIGGTIVWRKRRSVKGNSGEREE